MSLKTFRPGGIHLKDQKYFAERQAIENLPEPKSVIIHLSQHLGLPAKALVQKGDHVLMGQKIAEAQGGFSVPVHASISGTVDAIDRFPHPVLGESEAIRIQNDFKSEWLPDINQNGLDQALFSRDRLLFQIQEAGIVGMGGATFPTHIKLNPPKDSRVDVLIINGAECEPFLTCDHRLMLEKTDTLLEGISILGDLLDIDSIYIGIEANKKDAISKIQERILKSSMKVTPQVHALKEKYPQGAEKSLIFALTRRIVPIGKLPFDVGVIVQNVATVIAIAEAIQLKKPLIERVITVSGDLIVTPKNLNVRIGTPLQNLIDYCGGYKKDPSRIILGGPMMGLAQKNIDVPITKGVSGVLLLSDSSKNQESPCIRCGRCIIHCPAGLMPIKIKEMSVMRRYDKAKDYHALSCIECGICSYQCPAKIPLLNYIRDAKIEINKRSRKS